MEKLPVVEHQFSWMKEKVNLTMECHFCMLMKNSECEPLYNEYIEKDMKDFTPKLLDCLKKNQDLYKIRNEEVLAYRDRNAEKLKLWEEFFKKNK
jgi:hypothetical protein